MPDIKLTTTTQLDFPTIAGWAAVDVDYPHRKIPNEFWLTGQGYFSGKVEDAEGITLFFRFDRECESLLRMHTQFANSEAVSKKRVATSIMIALPLFIEHAKEDGIKGIIFETTFPELAAFMGKMGFKKCDGENKDYILKFEPIAVDCGTF